MNRIALALVSVLALFFAATAQSAEIKIAFVNSSTLLEQAPQADIAKKKLEKEFAPREKEIRDAQQTAQALETKLNRDGVTMSDSDRSKQEQELNRQLRDLQRMQSNFRDDLNLRKNEELGKLQRVVLAAIKDVAKTKGYDLILAEGVVYAAPQVDITSDVLAKLKQDVSAGK
ncbi:OmpH family outer membrane protein [Halothiobacillus neapolitanus]|uniref:Outer membrane chaperone Skp (OmpH) n=1 Tax=Halothiobacillus neapolitanus (strain ATCC 23641 / DSM 15147 / CIP 104769 / NCIMB 8539 / c2) TaxID=555778 RepID=D0L0Q4_HALNC|nr:OmpH family outer membrane protein [Halothiobacillus neapolitanus]ACX96277.1 outer membrane chaperone Skp (OmpH) [Halothiobacillus neapolitanus c2]TDN66588.1 periplasmic chaperone for outer membrane proteins Skp [Halothiobacillus neapolitanus]